MNRDTGAAELGWVRRARASVLEARRLLARPSTWTVDEGAPHLQAAVTCLEDLKRSLRSRAGHGAPGALAQELAELRREVSHTTALVERAAAFYYGWVHLLYVAACGYTAGGQPGTPGPMRRLSLEG